MTKMTASRKAWHQLLDTLKEIDLEYLSPARNIESEADIAEGIRWITHILRNGFDYYLENDPELPHFTPMITPTKKYQGDGPDHPVYYAPLDGKRSYRISGQLTGEVYLSFTCYHLQKPGGWADKVVAHITSEDMIIDEDGRYEVILSPPGGAEGANRLELTEDAHCVMSRHYYQNARAACSDPDLQQILRIEPIDEVTPMLPYGDDLMAAKLQMVDNFIRSVSVEQRPQTPETMPAWFSLQANQLPQAQIWTAGDGGGFGAVDIAYTACPFYLEPGQALIMEGIMPECLYSSVALWNRFLQTLDHRYRQIALNKTQMERDNDGHFRIVIAAENPGVANWLDTEGRSSGIIYWRFMFPKEEIAPISVKTVALDQL